MFARPEPNFYYFWVDRVSGTPLKKKKKKKTASLCFLLMILSSLSLSLSKQFYELHFLVLAN